MDIRPFDTERAIISLIEHVPEEMGALRMAIAVTMNDLGEKLDEIVLRVNKLDRNLSDPG